MRARWLALYVVGMAALGEGGHLLFEHFGWPGHHLFHALYPMAAFVVFVSCVMAEVKRHGMPRFSWRLRQDA